MHHPAFLQERIKKTFVVHFLFYVGITILISCHTDTVVELLFVPGTLKKFFSEIPI